MGSGGNQTVAPDMDSKERIEDCEFSLMLHESGVNKFSDVVTGKPPREVNLIIGPEGGISDDEAALFMKAGAQSVVLGKPVFRSAHAGVAALAAVQSGFGIW
jgi:16S rRNA (uracil1498-N3)-methyltransferase